MTVDRTNWKRRSTPWVTLLVFLTMAAPAYAQPFVMHFEHVGTNDPKGAEGWTALGEVGSEFGAISDIGGVPAWFADDNSASGPSGAFYTHTPSPEQITQAASFGWKLSAWVRVVDVPDATGPNLASVIPFLFRDGSVSWQLHLGTEADGDPIIELFTGESFTLQGGGSGYHFYELVFDPLSGTADVFLNGIEVLSDLSPFAFASAPMVGWGNGSTMDTGQGNFNLVRFEVGTAPGVPAMGAAPRCVLIALLFTLPFWPRIRLAHNNHS
jgi:hypothetical protein